LRIATKPGRETPNYPQLYRDFAENSSAETIRIGVAVAVIDKVAACKESRIFKVIHIETEALHRRCESQTERGDDARECSLGTGHVGLAARASVVSSKKDSERFVVRRKERAARSACQPTFSIARTVRLWLARFQVAW
jgi:hypothetical protein